MVYKILTEIEVSMQKRNEEITFKDLLGIFIPKLWIIAIVATLFGAIMGVYTSVMKNDTYTSSSTMYANRDTSTVVTPNDMIVAENMTEIYKSVLTSHDVLSQVIKSLPEQYSDYNISIAFLRSAISFSTQGNGIFKISVTTGDAKLSFALAECIEDMAPAEIMHRVPNALPATIIESPRIASAPNDKGVFKSIIIGFLVGAALSVAVVWVVAIFDVVIRDKKKIEDNFNFPVLAVIPVQSVSSPVTEEVE